MGFISALDANGRVIPKGSKSRPARYVARWRTPDGKSREKWFDRKIDAERHLTSVEHTKHSGAYVDSSAGDVTLDKYSTQWIATRRTARGQPLRPKTVALYEHQYDKHIKPTLGRFAINSITPAMVRSWHSDLTGTTSPAKCYRLLRAMLNTAVDDELIMRNPCRIKGGGVEVSPERPIPSGDEVWALAAAMPARWRALVLTSAFAGLRVGELLGLQRRDVDLEHGTIAVERQVVEVGRRQIEGPPKSDAGVRTVSIPMVLVPELRHHLAEYTRADPLARVFVGAKGATPKNTNLNADWREARAMVGRDDLHLHDLRHFANTLAASAGASTKELMARLGHASPRAALRYQHATRERDRAIADAMDRMITGAASESSTSLRAVPGA